MRASIHLVSCRIRWLCGVAITPCTVVGPVEITVVAGHELIEVFARERIGLEREVLVSAKIVDPEFLGPGGLARGLLVEEEYVGFHALRIEETSRQTQERVYLTLVQELTPDSLPRPTFEEDRCQAPQRQCGHFVSARS